MDFDFTIHVHLEREEGKFASRDEMADQIREAIESADPGSLDGDAGGTYATTEWQVDEMAQPTRQKVKVQHGKD